MKDKNNPLLHSQALFREARRDSAKGNSGSVVDVVPGNSDIDRVLITYNEKRVNVRFVRNQNGHFKK